jgi:hypothetical protein
MYKFDNTYRYIFQNNVNSYLNGEKETHSLDNEEAKYAEVIIDISFNAAEDADDEASDDEVEMNKIKLCLNCVLYFEYSAFSICPECTLRKFIA